MPKKWDPLLLILSLFLIFKTFFLFQHNHLSPDGAMIGLMARHILEGNFPVFFYGYGYIGSLKSLIAAGLFLLFGATSKTLLLLPALFYIGFALTAYWYVSLIANRFAANMALLLCILASQWLTLFSAEIVGGYIDTLFYGNLMLIFLHKIFFGNEEKKQLWVLALGIVCGLAFWQFPLSGYYLITIGFCLFVFRPANIFSKTLPVFSLSFIAGSFPFWLYNIFHRFVSFKMVRSASTEEFFTHIGDFFTHFIPSILGWGFQADSILKEYGWHLIAFLFYLSLIKILFSKTNRQQTFPVLVLFLVSLFLFSRNNYVGERSPMVALPLLFIFPAAMSLILSSFWKKYKSLFFILLCPIIYLYGVETYASSVGREQNAEQFNRVEQNILQAVKEANVKKVYAPYAIAPLLSFQTKEEIISGSFLEESIPGYKEKLASAVKPGFIWQKDFGKTFKEYLTYLGCTYKTIEVENHLLFYNIERNFTEVRELANLNWNGPKEIFDRNISTRWSTREPQEPGQSLTLDLGKAVHIGGIELRSLEPADMPRSLKIEVSPGGDRWEQAAYLPPSAIPLYFSVTQPMSSLENGRMEIFFPTQKARYLKLTQLGRDKTHYWSIHELFVFQTSNTVHTESKVLNPKSALKEIKAEPKEKVYTDTWLKADLNQLYNPRIQLSYLIPKYDRPNRYILWNQNPYFVIYEKNLSSFEASGYYSDTEWEKTIRFPWVIFQKKKSAADPKLELISNANWSATASHQPERAGRGIGRPDKAWESFEHQKKGMYYQLNLGTAQTVKKIEINCGPSYWEYSRFFDLKVSSDGENWEPVKILKTGVPFWDGRRILKSELKDRILPIWIEPAAFQYLRIELTQDFFHSQWRISDIRLYQ